MESLLLVRHALAGSNRDALASSTAPGEGLTAEGRAQAAKLREALLAYGVDLGVSTDFARTLETLELALEGRDVPRVVVPELNEIRFGHFDGGPLDEYRAWAAAELPTTLAPDGRSRPPHLRSWRDGWRHLKLLLEFAPHWLFLYPGGVLASMGALIALALIPGPLALGGITLDNATLLFAVAAILVGTQLVLFYAVAKSAAVAGGMLPASARFRQFSPMLSVDRLCLVGGGLFAAGFLTALAAAVFSRLG